jgi:ferredoxin
MSYDINADCVNCGVCEAMCPMNAISESEHGFVIRRDRCNQCGMCAQYCPARAIIRREDIASVKGRRARRVFGVAPGKA